MTSSQLFFSREQRDISHLLFTRADHAIEVHQADRSPATLLSVVSAVSYSFCNNSSSGSSLKQLCISEVPTIAMSYLLKNLYFAENPCTRFGKCQMIMLRTFQCFSISPKEATSHSRLNAATANLTVVHQHYLSFVADASAVCKIYIRGSSNVSYGRSCDWSNYFCGMGGTTSVSLRCRGSAACGASSVL